MDVTRWKRTGQKKVEEDWYLHHRYIYEVIEFNNVTSGANQENYVKMKTKSSEKDSHLIVKKDKNFLD